MGKNKNIFKTHAKKKYQDSKLIFKRHQFAPCTAQQYATAGLPTHMTIPSALRVAPAQIFESNLEAQVATKNF